MARVKLTVTESRCGYGHKGALCIVEDLCHELGNVVCPCATARS